MADLNYSALEEVIKKHDWWFAVSELHGMLTALTIYKEGVYWPSLLALKEDKIAETLIPELLEHIEKQLKSDTLSYQLLLAEDNPLAVRAESLAQWAQGFTMTNDYLREIQRQPQLEHSAEEFIQDVKDISQLDIGIQDTEENRRLLTDLEEHCRMGALMLYAEVHSQ